MKNLKITFTSLMILGLFFLLTVGCQSEFDEVINITTQDDNLTATLHDDPVNYHIDMKTEKGHGLTNRDYTCVGCHQGSNRIVLQSINDSGTELVPHNIMINYYEGYVANHTQENAAMNNIDIEGVKEYIAKYK